MHHRPRISTIARNEMRRIVTSMMRAISSDSNFWPAQKLRSVGKLEKCKNGKERWRKRERFPSLPSIIKTAKEVNYLFVESVGV